MMVSNAGATFVLTMAVIAGLIAINAALVEVLLITSAWCRIASCSAVLVTEAAIFWRRRVVMTSSISL